MLEAYQAARRIDVYYCLGDTVGYGGSPNECCDLVREHGRSRRSSATTTPPSPGRMDYSYYYEAARHALDIHAAMLSPREHGVAQAACRTRMKLDRHRRHLCHGSPVRLEEFEYIFAPEQARECLPIWDELGHITFIGHSHLCKVFALTHDERRGAAADRVRARSPTRKYIVSVGSVGQPRDYDNRASYTVYDTDKKRFEFKRVEYDIETAADKILRAKLERNFAHRLFIGV